MAITAAQVKELREKSGAGVMDYPGDPDGKAGDVINCRCILVPVVLPPEERS